VHSLAESYYSWTGQPSVDPVVIFKLHLLGYLFNIRSERQLCEEASLNLAWRWFLGYELGVAIPDHSVLTNARCLWDASTHAAAKLGVREYSRSNPPSLTRHLIAPVLTARNWPFGGWSRSPRCGRALM